MVKHNLKITVLIFVAQIFNLSIQAQSNSTNFEIIKGIVVDDSTGIAISLVNIFNESDKTWDYANEKGVFNIWSSWGDTLVFSAVGYFSKVVFATDSCLKKELTIRLDPLIYQLREAKITALKSYARFKQDVLTLELPKTELDSINQELTNQSIDVAIESEHERQINEIFAREKGTLFVIGVGTIASSIQNKKKQKQNTNPKKAHKNKVQQQIIASKFNSDIVNRITKLTERELIEFMTFCDFSAEYLVLASPYEIVKAVSDKFKEYKEK